MDMSMLNLVNGNWYSACWLRHYGRTVSNILVSWILYDTLTTLSGFELFSWYTISVPLIFRKLMNCSFSAILRARSYGKTGQLWQPTWRERERDNATDNPFPIHPGPSVCLPNCLYAPHQWNERYKLNLRIFKTFSAWTFSWYIQSWFIENM